MSLRAFFHPASVAVVGASATPGKSGHLIVKNLVELGFDGAVFPINPRAETICGRPVFRSLAACATTPELTVIAVPREHAPAALRETVARGCRHAIVATGGFADTGDERGLALDRELREIAADAIRLMGPNSIGTIDTASGLVTSITRNQPLPKGAVSFFGQTGLFASGVTRWIAETEPFGVAKIACLGNKNDIDEIDLLRFLADDEQTRVVGCYVEGVRDGREFLAAARQVAAHKPLVVVKGGVTARGGAAAAGHTGSLAGDAAVFAGALRQAGGILAHDLEDLFDLLAGFAHGPLPAGRRVGVASITGAGCVLAADAASHFGLAAPPLGPETLARVRQWMPAWMPVANPVDIWGSIEKFGVEQSYENIGLALAQDAGIDMLVLAITLFPGSIFDVGPLVSRLREAAPGKPIATVLLGGGPLENRDWMKAAHRAGAATFPSLRRALRVLAAMADVAEATTRGSVRA